VNPYDNYDEPLGKWPGLNHTDSPVRIGPTSGVLDLGPVVPSPVPDWNADEQRMIDRQRRRIKRKKSKGRLVRVRRKRERMKRW
jgi:hypothetical protein